VASSDERRQFSDTAWAGSRGASNGVFLRFPGQWDDPIWQDASLGAGVYYNVLRWHEAGTGRFGRSDPIRLGRALEAYRYAGGRPTVLLDLLGLQSTSGPAPTGDPAHDKCCSAAHKKNLFGQIGAAGIVVCCNGNKVACALEYRDPRLTTSGKLAQQLWINCTFEHEAVHIQDLPDCPPCEPGPTFIKFPTAQARAASECRGLGIELDCLEKAKAGCGGDSVCANAIEVKKGQVGQDQQRFGCVTP